MSDRSRDLRKELGLKPYEKIIATWKGDVGELVYGFVPVVTSRSSTVDSGGQVVERTDTTDFHMTANVKRHGVLVLTSRELVFVDKKKAGEKHAWIKLEEIRDISMQGGWNPSITIVEYAANERKFWLKEVGQKEFESFRQLVMDWSKRRSDEVRRGPEGELEFLGEWLRANPEDADTWHDKANCLAELGRFEEELECYNQMLKINRNFYLWKQKGGALHNLRRYEEALECYNQVLKDNPKNVSVWGCRGRVLHDLGRHDEELECYDEVLKIEPEDPIHHLEEKGVALHEHGRHEEELKCYDEMLKIRPDQSITFLNDKGVALHKHGRYEEAVTCFEKAISSPDLYASKEWTIRDILKNRIEALKASGKWRSPEEALEWFNKGEDFRVDKKDSGQAVECYEEALKIFSVNALLYSFPPVGVPVYDKAYPSAQSVAISMMIAKEYIERVRTGKLQNGQEARVATQPQPETLSQRATNLYRSVSLAITKKLLPTPTCSICHRPLTFVREQRMWYCHNCQRYDVS